MVFSMVFSIFALLSAGLRQRYQRWVDRLASNDETETRVVLQELKEELLASQRTNYEQERAKLKALEEILVALLGHHHEVVRESAVILLNVLYDGHSMQMREPLAVTVTTVGETPVISTTFFSEPGFLSSASIVLRLYGPTAGSATGRSTWTEHAVRRTDAGLVFCQLPPFPRAGFYDWMFEFDSSNLEAADRKRVQGRYIVHPKSSRESKIVEIPVDQAGAVWDESTGKLKKRGSFDAVLPLLCDFRATGATAVYLMGALERVQDDTLCDTPFVIADRARPASILGGKKAFSGLIRQIKMLGMTPIVDAIDRVSLTHAHRKYRNLAVHTAPKRGRPVAAPHPGTDGNENQWEETVLFNFRKIETWNLMLAEVSYLIREYGIGGVRLDNAQSTPVIMAPDINELFRQDLDGEYYYTVTERLLGSIVRCNEESGYWRTEAALYRGYPNPFLMKFAREVWSIAPEFVLIAESHFLREYQLIVSGFVPHSIRVPQILASISGKSLRRNGIVAKLSKSKMSTAATLSRLYKNDRMTLPKGSIMISCTCTHLSPYPGAIYGRRTWLAVDLMFLLPEIPMLLYGETTGTPYRVNMAPVSEIEEDTTHDLHYDKLLPKSPEGLAPVSPKNNITSLSLGTENISRTNSVSGSSDHSILENGASLPLCNDGCGERTGSQKSDVLTTLSRPGSPSFWNSRNCSEKRADMMRNQSRDDIRSLGVRSVSAADFRKIQDLAEKTRTEIGPNTGFDITRINGHYEHRALLRQENDVLRNGEFCVISTEPYLKHQVFAFARFSKADLMLVVVNCRDWEDGEQYTSGCSPELDLSVLWGLIDPQMTRKHGDLFKFVDLFTGADHSPDDLYTLEEIVFRKVTVNLAPLGIKVLKLVQVAPSTERSDKAVRKIREDHYLQCLRRLQEVDASSSIKDARENHVISDLARGASRSLDSFALALEKAQKGLLADGCNPVAVQDVLKLCLQRASTLRPSILYRDVRPPFDFEPPSGERVISYVSLLSTVAKNYGLKKLSQQLVSGTARIGPLVFVTAELGRFSSAGGLGVMVDELTKSFAKMELEVYVCSPYYAVNRKGQVDYLGKHIKWTRNILVNLGVETVEVGVFEGREDGVHLIFLERRDFFPKVYDNPRSKKRHVQKVALFSRGSLEVLCQKALKPAMVITNDWLPGFCAAYARNGHFGSFFDNTSFFHLIHNLGNDTYEGRVYPDQEGDDMCYIHQLPRHVVVDPWRARVMISPTRAALLCSDSWGTVSESYLRELIASHSLSALLQIAKAPFGFPNGIPMEERKALLRSRGAESHAEAKARLQKRYFPTAPLDAGVPLMAFVGRVTAQKGVHMILDAVDDLMKHTNGRIQVIVGGPANFEDSYAAKCAARMYDLRRQFPSCFWADPNEFFTDGPLVNLGADFGLMPSLFEPGGIVQQEFFVAGTPVIAYHTGGLKDTVREWNSEGGEGNGFSFAEYTQEAFVSALKRAIRVFSTSSEYERLRHSAFNSTIDVKQVALAWSSEFHRIRNAIYSRSDLALSDYLDCLREHSLLIESSFTENDLRVIDLTWSGTWRKSVTVSGSWDGWSREWVLYCSSNPEGDRSLKKVMTVKLLLVPGRYQYKYRVDGEWQLSSAEAVELSDCGEENNVLVV